MERGDLRDTSTAALLRRFADEKATGCLRIDQHGTRAAVWLRGGAVYTATAPMARTRLGDRLVGAQHLTGDQLGAALSEQQRQRPAPRLGELLIAKGIIDRETLRAVVREQIADSVAAALSWTSGTWSFNTAEEVAEDVTLDMSVENLVMEGARRLEEWEVIRARVGSLEAVVDFVGRGHEAELALTPDEWSMLTRIDGASSIREIAEGAGYGQFEAARIIYGLLTAGVVALLDEAGDGPQPEEPRAPASADVPEDEAADATGPYPDEPPEPDESLGTETVERGHAPQPHARPDAAAEGPSDDRPSEGAQEDEDSAPAVDLPRVPEPPRRRGLFRRRRG